MVQSYREDLDALVEYLTEGTAGELAPQEITTVALRGYVAAMHDAGYASSSVARRLASMRSFFRFAQRDGVVDANPAKPLRNPRRQHKLPHFLTNRQVSQLLNAPPTDQPLGLRDRAILETLYSTGVRVSELVDLNRKDLDAEGLDRDLPRSLAIALAVLSAAYALFHLAVLNFWSIDEWVYRVMHVNMGAVLAFIGLKAWRGEGKTNTKFEKSLRVFACRW